jgi:hypothetical protein
MTADTFSGVSPERTAPRPLARFLLEGTWRFALVSLGGFSVWAFAGKWWYRRVGEAGLYAVTTAVFLGLAVLLLYPLVSGSHRVWRFCRAFMPAFLAYAVAWCALWFVFGAGLGEWLGSLAGSLVFVALTGWGLGRCRGVVRASAVFFLTHSVGYFAGGWMMGWVLASPDRGALGGLPDDFVGIIAKLAWGLAYGVGFGAGLGYTYHRFQVRPVAVCTGVRSE